MRRVAEVEVDALKSARDANSKKALALRMGIAIGAVGFTALGVGAMVLLLSLIP